MSDFDASGGNGLVRRHSSIRLRSDNVKESDKEANFFVKWLVFHPLKICSSCVLITLLCFLAMSNISVAIDEPRAWLIQTGEEVDMWDARIKSIESVNSNRQKPVQSQENFNTLMQIFFKSNDDNILTPENVNKIIETTHGISNETDYQNKYCFWDVNYPNSACAPSAIDTIIYEFQGKTQDEINAHLDALPSTKYHYFGKEIADEKRSNMFVSYLKVGLPFPNCETAFCNTSDYYSATDDFYKQVEPMNEWMHKTVWEGYNDEDSDLKIYPLSFEFFNTYLTNEALAETNILLFFCILVIFSYVVFHTQSLFLGGLGMLQIIICFGPAFVAYWYVVGVHRFGFMNAMIIFVILGIGADDMFVMTDAWVQSVHVCESDIDRMSYTFHRAGKAMLITSVTTASAFFATTVSQILPIKSFGVWAGWVVLFNYVYFIIMFPAMIMLQHHNKKLRCCYCHICCRFNCCKDLSESEEITTDANSEGSGPNIENGKQDEVEEEYRWIETFFKDTFSTFIIDYKYFIIGIYAIITAVGIYCSTTLEPPEGLEDSFRKGSKYATYYKLFDEDVYQDPLNNNIEIVTIWGVNGIDRSGESIWQSGGGSPDWDSNFDLKSAASQQHIYDYCQAIKAETIALQQNGAVDCFMEGFKTYIGAPWPKTYATDADLISDLNAFLGSSGSYYDVNGRVGIQDGVLRYVEITTMSPISIITSTRNEKKDSRTAFRDFLEEWNNRNVPGVDNGKMTSVLEWGWPWLETEPWFAKGAMTGIGIALPIAFMILLIFTNNIIVSFFAIFAIFGVMLTMTIMMFIANWDFGVIESIALVVVIGFSVDYVVHLGHAYLESTFQDREQRLTMALLTMGVSVTSGAFTTALSGVPLCFSVFIFFYKMGLLIVFVCFLALSWSLLFFMALLAVAGPEGDTGDILVLFQKCYGGERSKVLATNVELESQAVQI